MQFQGYELKDFIVKAIKDLGFKDFSTVQKDVFNSLKENKNLLVRSKTGSGKTHAFLIPIFNALDPADQRVQAVIISPTTELARQTYKVCQHMASFSPNTISVRLYVGGTDKMREMNTLKNSQPQIVIATPGRLKDLVVDENVLKAYTADTLVVDEVDMCLDSGYAEAIDAVAAILKDKKMMFFSATMAETVLPFIKKYLDNPKMIDIKDNSELNITHIWIPLKHRDRFEMLQNLLALINPYLCIIFCNKKETVISLANALRNKGIPVGEIHGDLSPRERKRVLKEAQDLKYQYIVASDLAARGIDLDGVSHVINYEIPKDFEFYIHRSGRTGRMNYTGEVYSFYTELDDLYLDNLAKKGVKPIYKVIKDGSLEDYKGRNAREKRIKPLNEGQKRARKIIHKPDKVTPGYKKKLRKAQDELSVKLYKAEGKKKKRRGN